MKLFNSELELIGLELQPHSTAQAEAHQERRNIKKSEKEKFLQPSQRISTGSHAWKVVHNTLY